MDKKKAERSWKSIGLGVLICALVFFALSVPPTMRAQTVAVDTGIDEVDVVQASATVEKIDLEKRKVALLFDDGRHKTFKVDKSVENLNRVQVGDHLKISFTEEVVVLVGKTGESPGGVQAGEISVAPKGAKPGIVMVETTAVSARVLAVDTGNRRVTLAEPDGKKKTIKLGKKATNLDQLKVGESIDMLVTDSLIVDVVK